MFKYLALSFLFVSGFASEKTEFIWNFGIISHCKEWRACSSIQKGDLVWVQARFLSFFAKYTLPKVAHPFVLIVADGDESFPSDCGNIEELIHHKKILHIFAQNCDYKGKSKKVSPLPIGIDFHTMANKQGISPQDQEKALKKILRELKPTSQRKKRAFVDFHHNDTIRNGNLQRFKQFGEDRTMIFNQLVKTGLIDHGEKMKRSDLWRKKGEYAFSISPHGNGLDCHRTWEDLVLGCIVIVKTSPLDPLYKELPVVIVKDWSEITAPNLEKWMALYGDAFTNPAYREKLTLEFWLGLLSKPVTSSCN